MIRGLLSTYGEKRRGFRLVEVELGVAGEVDAAYPVGVAFAVLFDAGTLPCCFGGGHVV